MKKWMTNSEGGKAGAIDGLNIFFGALLGANLGTIDKLPIFEYVKLIFLLSATVMTLRMLSTSDRRRMMLASTLVYAFVIVMMLVVPEVQPKGMDPGDLHRLVATLIIWIGFVLAAELSPTEKSEGTTAE